MNHETNLYLCRKCGRWLERSMFHRDVTRPEGINRWCKQCVREHRFRSMGLDRTRRILARFSNAELQAELERRLKELESSEPFER